MGLYFKAFGVPELLVGGRDAVCLRYRKAYMLLGYLAVERGRWHERKRLADLIWPHLAQEAARANLRLVLKSLADAVDGNGACLRIERERIGLFADGSFDADVLLFDDDKRKALRQCREPAELAQLLAPWRRWLDHMEGELLSGVDAGEGGEFENWLQVQRTFFEHAKSAFLRDCMDAARRCGAADESLKLANAWVRCCPVVDEAARAQMEVLAEFDGPAAALDAYADFVRRLKCLVDGAPAAQTEQLRAHLAAAAGQAGSDRPAAAARDEVRHVVVLHVEPDMQDEAELLEPERSLAPLDAALDAALTRWGGKRCAASGVLLGAVFGLADDGEQAPRRALAAALELAALPAFRRARIGLAEGKALISAAARQPIAGSVLPALAQRLAMCGDAGDVIAAESLAGALGADARLERLPARRLPGLAGDHRPCRLVAVPAAGAAYPEFATPFVGRRDALAYLDAAVAETARTGRVRFVEIVGVAGTGKSRLLAEFARRHALAGGEIRWIGHRPESRHVALGALRDYARARGENMGSRAGQSLIDALIARLFAPSAATQPVLLVCDDVHWADEATRELLRIAMQAPPAHAVLALLACRPDAGRPDGADVRRLSLAPLSLDDAIALIAAGDPDGRIDSARRFELAHMSGGLPLCAEYIARAARDQPVSDASLFGVLQSVLDRMGEDKLVLQAASVLGISFRTDALRTLLPEADVDAALARAAALAIVEGKGDGGYIFHHALLRDCAYESAPPQTRRAWHRRIAAWLAQQPGAAAADVAEHYAVAQAWSDARKFWRQAAEAAYLDEFPVDARAAAVRALAAAAKEEACPAAERAELELLAGYAALMTDGYGAKGAQKFFAPLVTAGAGALPDEILFRALAGMAAAHPQGRHKEMMERLGKIARTPAHHMMVSYGVGTLLRWRGEFAASLRHFDEAIRLGESIPASVWLRYSADNPVIACRALKAVSLAFSGSAAAAMAAAAVAVADARREGRVHGLCFALTLSAGAYMILDRPDETERLAAEGLELATARRFQFWQAYNALLIFWAKARRGETALRKSFKLLSMHREIAAASRLSPVTSWWFVGCICEALESWTLLDSVAARALALAEKGGDTYCMPDLMRQRALVRHARGDARGALRWLERAAALIRKQGSLGLMARLARTEAAVRAPACPTAPP